MSRLEGGVMVVPLPPLTARLPGPLKAPSTSGRMPMPLEEPSTMGLAGGDSDSESESPPSIETAWGRPAVALTDDEMPWLPSVGEGERESGGESGRAKPWGLAASISAS